MQSQESVKDIHSGSSQRPKEYKKTLPPRPDTRHQQTITQTIITSLDQSIKMVKTLSPYIVPKFSPESDIHFVNIRFEPKDYPECDYTLLLIMRNSINLRTAVISQHCPMAKQHPGVVSIKIQGNEHEDQVFDQAADMVRKWQQENNGHGNFIFDRGAIWRRPIPGFPFHPRAPRLSSTPCFSRQRSSGPSVCLSDEFDQLLISPLATETKA